jgi:hypothetical protein
MTHGLWLFSVSPLYRQAVVPSLPRITSHESRTTLGGSLKAEGFGDGSPTTTIHLSSYDSRLTNHACPAPIAPSQTIAPADAGMHCATNWCGGTTNFPTPAPPVLRSLGEGGCLTASYAFGLASSGFCLLLAYGLWLVPYGFLWLMSYFLWLPMSSGLPLVAAYACPVSLH